MEANIVKHYLINPTWRCHSRCSYCWVEQTVRLRSELYAVTERPFDDWVLAIQRDRPDVVDIAGGEPLLLDWIPDLIFACPETYFGLSTNGLAWEQLNRICVYKPHNLTSINISYHPETADRLPNYDKLWQRAVERVQKAQGKPHCNIVMADGNVERSVAAIQWMEANGVKYELSPYERVNTLGQIMDQGLCCKGGVNHLTVAPDGTAWSCLTTLRSPFWESLSVGNWLDDTIDLDRKPQPCYLNCVDYYVLPELHKAGDMWCIEAKPCEY
uniref:Putative radical SAM superfamily protein n=1 Tax=viral metagenome TaxID=1070528 RepID=A0A6H1ZC39_9ZZZZ